VEIDIVSSDKPSQTTPLTISDAIFNEDYNEALISEVLTAYMAGARQKGTANVRNRSAVRGGGAKPWRQKGTGRARAGTIRGPLWRGGGATFSDQTNFKKKVNKKAYKKALRSIVSQLLRQDKLVVLDDLSVSEISTANFIKKLNDLSLKDAIIVHHEVNEALYLSSRNVPHIDVIDVRGINPYSLLRAGKVVLTSKALRELEGVYA
jgi:large subunit ribosomal protein L4